MKKFVKVLAILLAIFMALAVFAACKEKNNDATPDDKPVDNNPVDDNPKQDDPTPAHEHAWDEGKVTKEATCTEAGEKVYTCSCGETKTEAVAALGHTWDEGKVTKEATTYQEGEKTYTCTVCGEVRVEVVEKLPDDAPIEAKGTIVFDTKDGKKIHKYVANGDGTYRYAEYFGSDTKVEVKATFNGRKVTGIVENAFSSGTTFTSITIAEGIEVIGESAFEGCTGLTEIVIPNSVTTIGNNAFKGCTGLTNVKLGAGTKAIPADAFTNCAKIAYLELGDGLESLDKDTFAASNKTLIKVVIGKNMGDLGNSFETAIDYKLVVIDNKSENEEFTAGTKVAALLETIADAKAPEKEIKIEVRIETDENGYVFYVNEKDEAFLIDYVGGGQKLNPDDEEEVIDPAKKILILPEFFTKDEIPYTIYKRAFIDRKDLAQIVFPKSVKKIGGLAFSNCSDLTITYEGTKTEWAAVEKVTGWDTDTGYKVVCSNGELCKAHGFEGIKVVATPPTCTEKGNELFYYCATCKTYFDKDKNITDETSATKFEIAAKGHNYGELIKATDKPTCTEDAYKVDHYHCLDCGTYFAGDQETVLDYTNDIKGTPATGHNMTPHDATPATCSKKGNSAYWSCSYCGKYFGDAEGNDEIEENSWVIPLNPNAHPGWDGNGDCTACGVHYCD